MRELGQAYITELERYIVEEWHYGSSPEEIAEELNIPPDKVNEYYSEAIDKIDALLPIKNDVVIQKMIDEFLKDIGVSKCTSGSKDLASAIYLGMTEPELLDKMTAKFYPVLAKRRNVGVGTVRVRISQVLRQAYDKQCRSGKDIAFFENLGMSEILQLKAKTFIMSAISIIKDNSEEYSHRRSRISAE